MRLSDLSGSNIYMDTLINPSYSDALGVVAQLPGLSGMANNLILFEFAKEAPEDLDTFVSNYRMLRAANFDVCVLATSDRSFGYRREIHVWITPADFAGTEGRANVLFVSSTHEIELYDEEEDQ